MGLVTSRLNLESLHVGSLSRSQQDEVCFSYSLSKNYFSNYFLMGGERYEVNDPDYLFGDNCDLNFLGCNKPSSIPYKKAQQYLLGKLKQNKSGNKVSSRVGRLGSPLSILSPTTNHQDHQQRHQHQQQQPQQQSSTPDFRKQDVQQTQTLGTKGSSTYSEPSQPLVMLIGIRKETIRLIKSPLASEFSSQQQDSNTNNNNNNSNSNSNKHEVSSLVSATSSTKSGYTSVKGDGMRLSSDNDDDDEDEDDEFKDALNDDGVDDDNESEKAQQHESLLPSGAIRITIEDTANAGDACANEGPSRPVSVLDDKSMVKKRADSNGSLDKSNCPIGTSDNCVYNIEFSFDTEVDCSIRIFYFCTRETTSTGITYKPLHATYKSKIYYYKKGLNQKFEQLEQTFQPYLFDEDLLIYKPLDVEGNYNSGSVFPIVIQCIALEGPMPRQSHSLVATIEKSQLDGSYTIKPLKQIIFADGVQFILQDIYGIEHKQLFGSKDRGLHRGSTSSSSQYRSLGGENSSECVICISEERDTMLLPCRHLCLCTSCAQSLRYQANSCPICRSPFRAALNIRPSAQPLDQEDPGRT